MDMDITQELLFGINGLQASFAEIKFKPVEVEGVLSSTIVGEELGVYSRTDAFSVVSQKACK